MGDYRRLLSRTEGIAENEVLWLIGKNSELKNNVTLQAIEIFIQNRNNCKTDNRNRKILIGLQAPRL